LNRTEIKSAARHAVADISYYSGFAALRHWLWIDQATRILTYHDISDSPKDPFSVDVRKFHKQISFLKKKFHLISLRDYREIAKKKLPIPRRAVVITFDDGLASFINTAYPVLMEENIPATCFIVATKPGSGDGRFMAWPEIKRIASEGLVEIGSHSLSHKSLGELRREEIYREAENSKAIIEEELAQPVYAFSYPYGTRRDFNGDVIKAVRAAGYEMAMTSINGINRGPRDMFRLKRTKIERGDDFMLFKKIMFGALDPWGLIDRYFYYLQKKKSLGASLFEDDTA
jgi:peptidoglycan/xylan/chitin deacetylase (PgdA/CDA1 family)